MEFWGRSRVLWVALCAMLLACGDADATIDAEVEAALLWQRTALATTLTAMVERPELFPAETIEGRVLPIESRAEVRRVWVGVYDRLLALQGIADAYAGLRRGDRAFSLHHAASLAHYRFSLDFIARFERDRGLDSALNEADPELGLPADSYTALKDDILNVVRAGSFASKRLADRMVFESPSPALAPVIREDAERIWAMGEGEGPRLTARHLAKRAEASASENALPLQEKVARRMAEIRVRRGDSALIADPQIETLRERLKPGDILLTRREWFVSNVGIPGFWSHAALYVGDSAERQRAFDTSGVRAWVRAQGEASGDFETLLANTRGAATALAASVGTPPARVLEAIASGVTFSPLERAAHADSIAVLRPALADADKARAIWRAFHYAGRPYDYNFDFRSDDALVCSELVYKAYRERPGEPGLALPLSETLGRPMISPNELARLYAEDETPRFELVAFLDGSERSGTASEAGADRFRTSWSRPKWHILLPDSGPTLVAGTAPDALPSSDLKGDEEVVFFATSARYVVAHAGKQAHWSVPIHAWVHEPETESLWRRSLLSVLRRQLGLEGGSEENALFRARAAPFLADNERGKVLQVAVAGVTRAMPASKPDGHVRGHVEVLSPGTGSPALLDLRPRVRRPDGRVFEGAVHLLEPSGVTIVSDLDDTVKISEVSDHSALLRNTFLREYRAVEGLAERYRAWESAGAHFEYVSSSPWQLYTPLDTFLRSAGYPDGSLHLKSFRPKDKSFLSLFEAPERTKTPVLDQLIASQAGRRFVLIGDSGERDPEIYGSIARRYPERIATILVREVASAPMSKERRQSAFNGVAKERVLVFRDASELPERPW